MARLKIAIDFDETTTADPALWFDFITNARLIGHDVRIVTFRNAGRNNEDISLFNAGLDIPVLYTSGVDKFTYCESFGWVPDIVIDDQPQTWGSRKDS